MPARSTLRASRRHVPKASLLLATVSLAALSIAGTQAVAKPLGGYAWNPSAAAVAASQAATQEASRAASSAGNSLKRATLAIQAQQAGQEAARAAARAALASGIPDGLQPGGLQMAPGVGSDPSLWQGANLPTETQAGGRTKVTIEQTQQKAILTWQSFNVSEKTDLTFAQPGATASVLNRVLDPSAAPSRILGSINAPGAVYVINRNGIIFGGGSTVNVGSLIASSLDIHGGAIEYLSGATERQKLAARNQRFLDGILAANPASTANVPLTFFDGTDMNTYTDRMRPGETFAAYDGVTVEAGARIGVGNLGQAVLLGHNVVNRGRIEAPDGQVLLAAGRGVLLLDGTLRDTVNYPGGEVYGGAPIRGFLAGVDRGGLAENSGLIVTERGNITLTGKNLNQNGVLISTTAAETAGSILIQAETGMTSGTNHTRNLTGTVLNIIPAGMFPYLNGERGEVSFGEGSYAAILPDLSGEKVVGNPYKPSTVEIRANRIIFQKDAALYVPAGEIRLVAAEKANLATPDGRIYLAPGAVLDVSGLRDVEIAMEQNTIRAELRANELSDNPVMRDSSLRGKTVYFDARYGSKLTDGTGIANLSGYYDLIERDVSQFMTVGGKIFMRSAEIIAREGSIIDLSGGSVRYLDGYVRRSYVLAANGAMVPIEEALANQFYLGLADGWARHSARWGVTEIFRPLWSKSDRPVFQKGYTEGRSAGLLDLNGIGDAVRIFDGDVVADMVVGERQTDPSSAAGITDVTRIWHERPSLATLNMGTNAGSAYYDAMPTGGNIVIADNAARLRDDFQADTKLLDYARQLASLYDGVKAQQHVLPSNWFDGSTFGNVTLISGGAKNGVLTIGEGTTVDVGAYGSFTFIGRQAEIAGTVRAAGGKVRVEALRVTGDGTPWETIPEAERPRIHLGGTGVIDVAGRWTSDRAGSDVLPVLDGGKVELISRTILLDKGSLIDASGGGHLTVNGKIKAGDGGSILLDTATPYTQAAAAAGLATGRLEMNGDIVAYALGRGGSLTIDTGDDVMISRERLYEGGVLPANSRAVRDLMLASDVVIPAGSYVPVPHDALVDYLTAGQPTPVEINVGREGDIITAADWIVPDWEVYDLDFNQLAPGTFVPAGTVLLAVYGYLYVGDIVPAAIFPDGISIQPTPMTLPPGRWPTDVKLAAGTIIPKGSMMEQAAPIVSPLTIVPEFFTGGGFSSYALSGARGMTVTSGTVVAPSVDALVLDRGAYQLASGARLYDALRQQNGVSLQNSSELPAGLRGPMELTLGTAPFNPDGTERPQRITGTGYSSTTGVNRTRHPGKFVMEAGSEIRMDAESTVRFDSLVDVFVDGTISTPGGAILIQANRGQNGEENGSVRLGTNARLLAGGYQKLVPGPDGDRRSVVTGGLVQINIDESALGSSWTVGTVLIDAQAVIDVSGVHGVADFNRGGLPALGARNRYTPVEVDGDAGSVAIFGKYGVIAGDLRLSPGGASGRGGSLSIGTGFTHWDTTRIVVSQGLPAGLGPVAQDTPAAGYSSLVVSADLINRSGADDLSLLPGATEYNRGIVFDGDVTLATRGSITLASYNLSTGAGVSVRPGSVELISSYVKLQGYGAQGAGGTAPASSDGRLTIRADLIDIGGGTRLGGFGEASFIATGDIRLSGSDGRSGTLTTAGSLLFDAAQLYAANGYKPYSEGNPRELAETDPGFLVDAGRSIAIRSNGRPAPVPLSFGQRLTLRAPVIDQGGVVRAPQGQIRLEASDRLTLRPGSLTSASLEGLTVPFGYLNPAGLFDGYQNAGWAPTKSVKLAGADVDVQGGAVVDVSGGGDLLGWSFVGGIGGTTNILADTSVERYAILPSLGRAPAPTSKNAPRTSYNDPYPLDDRRLKYGDAVYLEGVPGLAAGYYTLLPAHYALLDGGMLIEPFGGSFAAKPASVALQDGSVLTGGYRAGGAARDAGYSRFRVMSNDVWKQYSEFKTVSFNQLARELVQAAELSNVRTIVDAGTVILAASRSLNLDGTGRLGAANGLLGNLDVSAAKIALASGSAAAPAGVLRLDAQQLEAFGGGSVLIGGTRSYGATGTAVTVGASEVTVLENTRFTGPELILAASALVDVRGGASLTAEGAAGVDGNPLLLSGDGALLRLSTGQRVGILRSGGSGAAGAVAVADGAVLHAATSLTFDGSQAIALGAQATIQAAQLDLASVIVNLGEVPAGVLGANLTEAMLERFAAASDLLIRGHQSIDLHGSFALGRRDEQGAATLKALTLDSGLIQGVGASARQPAITAQSLSLRNSGAAGSYAGPDTAATLNLDVDRLLLGPGNIVLGGFNTVQGRVGELRVSGKGAFNVVNASTGGAGSVSLGVGRITAAAGSDYAVTASGQLQLDRGAFAGDAAEAPFGGRLALQAPGILLNTLVLLPAGAIDIRATAGDLVIGDGAVLDVSGRAIDFRDTRKFAPGGGIRLEAAGQVSLTAGAQVDVSGSASGGAAGRLDIIAQTAQIEAVLRGQAANGYAGGAFSLDADQLAGSFASLADKLGNGFDREIDVRLRAQDIALGAGQRLEAHRVTLRSDSGWVDIGGTIAAAGDMAIADGGAVRLIGEQGVRLQAGARIEAQAGAATAQGYAPASGIVELASAGTRSGAADAKGIDVAAGAVIDVSGGRSGGGRILMRANATAGDDLATIFRIAPGSYLGAREQGVVAVRNYDVATVDAAVAGQVLADLQAAPAGALAGFAVTGGALLRNQAGDLTISADIDLGGALNSSGWIGFAADQDILVNATVSDGFASSAKAAALKSAPSFSLDFESGRDIVVGGGRIIRTGTGAIRMAAGRDLVLSDNQSAIYTAGAKTPTQAGFTVGTKLGEHPTSGGDIVLSAVRDISAPVVKQSTAAWLFHYGETNWTGDPAASTVSDQTSWSIMFGNFESGVGALGGGDVRVRAGRDSRDLSVAVPTTGHLVTPTTPAGQFGPIARTEDLVIRGGGNLAIETGRDLLGGVYMLGRGHAELEAGNRIAASGALGRERDSFFNTPIYKDTPIGMLIGLMDASASLTAVGDITIEGVYDPMLVGQVAANLSSSQRGSGFISYSDRAGVEATSISGDTVYRSNLFRPADLGLGGAYEVRVGGISEQNPREQLSSRLSLLPPTLRLASLQSDVSVAPTNGDFAPRELAPSASGTLEFLASGDILIGRALKLQDVAVPYRRGPLAPFATDRNTFLHLGVGSEMPQPKGANSNWERGFTPLHLGDAESVRLYALNGTIGTASSQGATWSITAPKPVDIYAGRDILNGAVIAQHNDPSQVSSIIAGRDIIRPSFAFLGQGALWVEAGRNLTFIPSEGPAGRGSIMSTGNVPPANFNESRTDSDIPNLALPDKGGDINIIAGTASGADYVGFAATYLDPRNASAPNLPLSHADNAGKVVRTYEAELAEFLKGLGYSEQSAGEARALFAKLPKLTQQAFLQRVLFTELKETGIDYNDADGPRFHQYSRGYAAIDRLFPAVPTGASVGQGDINLRGGIVQTQSGGAISVMAPYGKVTVGYDAEIAKNYGTGGVVTRRGGDVRIMSDGSIDLYVSRVFTLQGGDLTMWTSNGNISAGSGAKTSVFNVPLKFSMDNEARVSIDAFGLSTGAGIGVLDANRSSQSIDAAPPPWALSDARNEQPAEEQRRKSRMDLLAFRGEINAGDAGIRVVGDFNIAALRVINADNIAVSGTSTGVPTVQAPNIGGLTEAGNASGAMAQQAAATPTQNATVQPSIIIVEVIGFGGGDGEESRGGEAAAGRQQQSYDVNSATQIVGLGAVTETQRRALTATEIESLE